MEKGREEIDPFEDIDDPTLRVQMQHEMLAIEELVFVTKLSFDRERLRGTDTHSNEARGRDKRKNSHANEDWSC
jgi:hypothetical protein